MSNIKVYCYRCREEDCGVITDALVTYEDRKQERECPECGGVATYTVHAPMVLTASYPDGYRRQNDPAWALLKEKSKLKLEAAGNITRSSKKEINAEIKKLRK